MAGSSTPVLGPSGADSGLRVDHSAAQDCVEHFAFLIASPQDQGGPFFYQMPSYFRSSSSYSENVDIPSVPRLRMNRKRVAADDHVADFI